MKAGQTLTGRMLNRTLLGRQLLLKRKNISIPRALERVAGLQTQYAPTAYIGLWSRLERFARDALTGALERRTVVQGTLMRSTIHTVSAHDYPLMANGVRDSRREWWLRIARSRAPGVDYPAMAAEADRLLADGPLRRNELVSALQEAGFPPTAFEGVGLWLDLIRVPPSGTWDRRRADLYQTAERWLGPPPGDRDAGLSHLVTRYLGGFGPSSPADIASWAGITVTTLASILDQMPLRRFRSHEDNELVDLPRLPVIPADAPAPVRFLGPWEAILLAHARPSGVLPEEYRALVFSPKNPHSVGTFLADGYVAGTWRQKGPAVTTQPFAPLPPRLRRELTEEAERLGAFLG